MNPVVLSTKEVAAQLGTNQTEVLKLARRDVDPLPLRYLKGKARGGFALVDELTAWLIRNTCMYKERKDYANKR